MLRAARRASDRELARGGGLQREISGDREDAGRVTRRDHAAGGYCGRRDGPGADDFPGADVERIGKRQVPAGDLEGTTVVGKRTGKRERAGRNLDGAGIGQRQVERKRAGGGGLAEGRAGLIVETPGAGIIEGRVVLKIPESAREIGERARAGEVQVVWRRKIDRAGVAEAAPRQRRVAGVDRKGAAAQDFRRPSAGHRTARPGRRDTAPGIKIIRAGQRAIGEGKIRRRREGRAAGQREGAVRQVNQPGRGKGGAGVKREAGVEFERAIGREGEGPGRRAALVDRKNATGDIDGAGAGERHVERQGAGAGGGLAQGRAGLIVESPGADIIEGRVVLKIPESAREIGERARAGEVQVVWRRKIDRAGVAEAAPRQRRVAGVDRKGAAAQDFRRPSAGHRTARPGRRDTAPGIKIIRAGQRAIGEGKIRRRREGRAAGQREGAVRQVNQPGRGKGGAGVKREAGVEFERAIGREGEGPGRRAALVDRKNATGDIDGAGAGERHVERQGAGAGGGLAQGRTGLIVETPGAGIIEGRVVLKIPEPAEKIGERARASEVQVVWR